MCRKLTLSVNSTACRITWYAQQHLVRIYHQQPQQTMMCAPAWCYEGDYQCAVSETPKKGYCSG
jgi:hypothetical protein